MDRGRGERLRRAGDGPGAGGTHRAGRPRPPPEAYIDNLAVGADVGIPGLRSHRCRHTFGTRSARAKPTPLRSRPSSGMPPSTQRPGTSAPDQPRTPPSLSVRLIADYPLTGPLPLIRALLGLAPAGPRSPRREIRRPGARQRTRTCCPPRSGARPAPWRRSAFQQALKSRADAAVRVANTEGLFRGIPRVGPRRPVSPWL